MGTCQSHYHRVKYLDQMKELSLLYVLRNFFVQVYNIKRHSSWTRQNLPENPSLQNVFAEYIKEATNKDMK